MNRSTVIDTTGQREIQKPIQSKQIQQFNELPNFLSYIDKRTPIRRSNSIHTLNLNNDQDLDLPPLKSQEDENFDILNYNSNERKYHNYNYNYPNDFPTYNMHGLNHDRKDVFKDSSPFKLNQPKRDHLKKMKMFNDENIILQDEIKNTEVLDYMMKFLYFIWKWSLLFWKWMYKVVLNYKSDSRIDNANDEIPNQEVSDTEVTQITPKPTPIKSDSFNVSSLNWGENRVSTTTTTTTTTDYGTHFILDNSNDPEPNIELEYIKKIFNNDGNFELPLYEQPLKEEMGIARVFNLSETFRNAIGHVEDVEIIEEKKQPVSKFDISLKDESLLLFEEEFKTYQSIIEEKRKRQELISNLKLLKESKVLKLNQHQVSTIQQYLQSQNYNEIVKRNLNGIDISIKDLNTLNKSMWLNDNIIDCYLSLVTKRSREGKVKSTSFSFTTHFYSTLSTKGYKSVLRWAKRQKIDVTQLDYIFVPINSMNTHWSLLVINNKEQKFQYYDSLSISNNIERNSKILHNLVNYMTEEDKRIHGGATIDFSKYKLLPMIKSPQQKNGSDCGVFTCTTVEFLARDGPLLFGQGDMWNLRLKIGFEILNENLLT